MKFEREKFYPGPGIEPGLLALRTSALPLRHPGQLPIQGRINLFILSFLTSGPTMYLIQEVKAARNNSDRLSIYAFG